MSRVYWQGSSEVLNPVAGPPQDKEIIFPLVEEEVLSVAFNGPNRHISTRCAINCTSRMAQRWALRGTSLNPRWFPYIWAPNWVVKAPASCLNNGVSFTRMTEHVENLRQYAPVLGRIGVIEETLGGEPVEADGCRVSGETFLFPVVTQMWDVTSSRILEYRQIPTPSNLNGVVETCLDAVGLDDGCFCIEFRRTPAWKVVEIHARLGEDARLAPVWGFNPIEQVESFVEDKCR